MLQEVASLLYNALKFELWGFDSGAAEDSRLRGCYAVSTGKQLSRFRKHEVEVFVTGCDPTKPANVLVYTTGQVLTTWLVFRRCLQEISEK